MYGMFSGASSFNADISGWNVANVEEMDYMFWKATAFSGNLDTWTVNPAVSQHRMFSTATPVVVDPRLEPQLPFGGGGDEIRGSTRVVVGADNPMALARKRAATKQGQRRTSLAGALEGDGGGGVAILVVEGKDDDDDC